MYNKQKRTFAKEKTVNENHCLYHPELPTELSSAKNPVLIGESLVLPVATDIVG
jgi:hypothetical protein